MRDGLWIAAFVWLIVLYAEIDGATLAFAQAGSTGGTIGKTDKSASGGEEQQQTRKPTTSSSCSGLSGSWVWYNGIDVTIRAEGTMTAGNGGANQL